VKAGKKLSGGGLMLVSVSPSSAMDNASAFYSQAIQGKLKIVGSIPT
jgi:hypothetical protein